jgi:hypothetical protein
MEITAHTCSICHRTLQWDRIPALHATGHVFCSRRGSRQFSTNIFHSFSDSSRPILGKRKGTIK